MPAHDDQDQTPAARTPWRLPIAAYLGLGLGGLVAVALGLLLWVTLSTIFKNTTELLDDKSRLFLGALSAQTRQFLDATLAPSNVVANEIAGGRVDPRDDEQMMPLMRTLLAATPQITAMAFFDIDETRVAAYREDGGVLAVRHPWPAREEIGKAVASIKNRRSAVWGKPIHDPAIGTFVNLRRPVFKDSDFVGMITAVINVHVLSRFLGQLETEVGQNAFILYDRDYVLAHPKLIEPFEGLSEDRPLPKVTEIGDTVLANIWREGWQEDMLVAGSGHADNSGETEYVFLYASLYDYADAPWLIGSYFTIDTIGQQFARMVASVVVSLLIVILSVVAIYLFGRFLRKPVTELSAAAVAVRDLDLDDVPVLPPSRFAELDDAGRAFNGMVGALRTFSLYVPRTLVQRLIARGNADAIPSEIRDVTVMLTDIVGFTSLAEQLSATDTADFLNHHLTLVSRCIEAEGGVIDKYMGDSVMALWGALDHEPDQALHAARAAIRIGAALAADNQVSPHPARVRIGIHSGQAVAGNIGTATRMNYTVVGDTVNMAQRLEALGKRLLPNNEVAILLSTETASALSKEIEVTPLGVQDLRGRIAQTEVFTLAGPTSS